MGKEKFVQGSETREEWYRTVVELGIGFRKEWWNQGDLGNTLEDTCCAIYEPSSVVRDFAITRGMEKSLF